MIHLNAALATLALGVCVFLLGLWNVRRNHAKRKTYGDEPIPLNPKDRPVTVWPKRKAK